MKGRVTEPWVGIARVVTEAGAGRQVGRAPVKTEEGSVEAIVLYRLGL